MVSDIFLFVKIFQLEKGFNIALQENRKYLESHPETDDGSMSIYFGKKVIIEAKKTIPVRYLNIEAEGKKNIDGKQKERQKEAVRSVVKMRI